MSKKGQTKSNCEMHARYRKIRINGKQVNVGRYVLEQKLSRKLQRNEYVHHINGDKLDDRPENLELVTAKEHAIIHISGKPGNRLGKHHTPEAIAKMRIAHKGCYHSPECIEKLAASMKRARKEHPEWWAKTYTKSDI